MIEIEDAKIVSYSLTPFVYLYRAVLRDPNPKVVSSCSSKNSIE